MLTQKTRTKRNHIMMYSLTKMRFSMVKHLSNRPSLPNATDPCVSRLTINLTILNVVEIIGYFVECRTRIIQLYE